MTDDAGCSISDSITAPSLDLTGVPGNFTLVKNNTSTFTGSWTTPTLPAGSNLIGYRLAYRLRNTYNWTTTALSADTFAVVDFCNTRQPAGNYEFVAFARYNDGSSNANSSFTCLEVKGYKGSGNKSSDASSSSEAQDISIHIYPNPTGGLVYVLESKGSRVQLTDVQ